METPIVKPISECFIKPKHEVEESKQPYYLGPFDLAMLSFHHIQCGLLFNKPSHINHQEFSIHSFLESLKESLAITLVHFYPLAGQLVTLVDKDKRESIVYVDCNKGPGARFIHASLDVTIFDILSPNYVPLVVRSLFDLNEEASNYDGHRKALLSVQVTELLDGVFIACGVNHCILDGTSYWQFWNMWSEIHNSEGNQTCESRLPVLGPWFPNGHPPPIPLPYTHPNEYVKKFKTPLLREKIFHFTSESISKLKHKANKENNKNSISSFQALCGLVWRSIIRANHSHLRDDQVVYNHLVANLREKLDPPLSKYYFGNCIKAIITSATACELALNNVEWGASLLNKSVANLNDKVVRDFVSEWLKSPCCYHLDEVHDYRTVSIEQSPRFDMYGNEFGLGKAIAVRSGYANKSIGVVYACPGYEGDGSVDLEICLPPDCMNALELDEDFMAFVSPGYLAYPTHS